MRTELEKWQLVNQAKSTDMLEEAIRLCADAEGYIESSHKGNDPLHIDDLLPAVKLVVHENMPARMLTGQYGIRQQALYLIHYKKP